MSDRIAVMSEGEVQQCGVPEEVYERPAGPFVAGFIGISNLLPGVVEQAACGWAAVSSARPPCPATARWATDGAALGAPGEDLARPARARDGVLEGSIVERVYVGTTTQVIVELAPGVRSWRSSRTPRGWRCTTAGTSATGCGSAGIRSIRWSCVDADLVVVGRRRHGRGLGGWFAQPDGRPRDGAGAPHGGPGRVQPGGRDRARAGRHARRGGAGALDDRLLRAPALADRHRLRLPAARLPAAGAHETPRRPRPARAWTCSGPRGSTCAG